MDRRRFLTTTTLTLTTVLAGCTSNDDTGDTTTTTTDDTESDPTTTTQADTTTNGDDGEQEDTTTTTEEEETTTTEEEAQSPDAQSFEGSGAEVRKDVTIEGGLTVIAGTHDGSSNFQVKLAGGEYDSHFINAIGQYDGAVADLVGSGTYTLDINADGDWTLELTQPRATSGTGLPTSVEGESPSVHGPIEFSGSGIASGQHDGERNFQAVIYPAKGSFGEHVFNEIGQYEGETTYNFDGIGWVDVNADGNYTIDFE